MNPQGILTTDRILSDAEVTAFRSAWDNQCKIMPGYVPLGFLSDFTTGGAAAQERTVYPRYVYREPPPLSAWVTMDPLVKLVIISLPVALLLAIMLI
jgi:hypothetical protein